MTVACRCRGTVALHLLLFLAMQLARAELSFAQVLFSSSEAFFDDEKKSKVPGWGIAVIIIGSVAVIAAVIIPIGCCCTCDSCEKNDVPTQYPKPSNPLSKHHSDVYSASDRSNENDASARHVDSSYGDGGDNYNNNNNYAIRAEGSRYSMASQFSYPYNTSSFYTYRVVDEMPSPSPPREPPLTRSQQRRLQRLSNADTADPDFGVFVSGPDPG